MVRVVKITYFLAFINEYNVLKMKRVFPAYLFVFLLFICPVFCANAAEDTVLGQVKTVVIDAGHGGHDPGCLGSSIQEKAVCLSVALKLGKLITNYFPDVHVVYTRDTDVFVKLHERAKIANDEKADLFISIHANSAGNKSAAGTETFVMGNKYLDKNLELTKRENSVILLEDDYQNKYEGYDAKSQVMDATIFQIIQGLYQQMFFGQSLNFAGKVERQFKSRNKRSSRGVKQRVLLVMYKTAMPSVLIEVGFLTNAGEHNLLRKKKGQEETAAAIFRAFLEYKREMEGAAPFEILDEEKKVFANWRRIYNGDSAFIKKIRPVGLRSNEAIKVETTEVVDTSELLIKVQFTSSSKKIALNSPKFKNLKDVSFYRDGKYYKYTAGNYSNFKDASGVQKQAREKGFKDAFLVAFYNGKRVSVKKARELMKK